METSERWGGRLPLEREAEKRLLGVAYGDTPEALTATVAGVMTSLAVHGAVWREDPTRPVGLVERLEGKERILALLMHEDLREAHLSRIVHSADASALRNLQVARALAEHPSSSEQVMLDLALRITSPAGVTSYLTTWTFLSERCGPTVRAAMYFSQYPHLHAGAVERLAHELGELGDEGFELFQGLCQDDGVNLTGSRGTNRVNVNRLCELVDQARLLCQGVGEDAKDTAEADDETS